MVQCPKGQIPVLHNDRRQARRWGGVHVCQPVCVPQRGQLPRGPVILKSVEHLATTAIAAALARAPYSTLQDPMSRIPGFSERQRGRGMPCHLGGAEDWLPQPHLFCPRPHPIQGQSHPPPSDTLSRGPAILSAPVTPSPLCQHTAPVQVSVPSLPHCAHSQEIPRVRTDHTWGSEPHLALCKKPVMSCYPEFPSMLT